MAISAGDFPCPPYIQNEEQHRKVITQWMMRVSPLITGATPVSAGAVSFNPTATLTSTDVQAALIEIEARITGSSGITAASLSASGASRIVGFSPSLSLTSTNVQAVVLELKSLFDITSAIVATHTTNLNTISVNVATISASLFDVTTQLNSLSATVVTHTRSISAINTSVTNLTNSLSALVVTVANASASLTTITTQLNSLSATVVTHTTSISAINTAVTNLTNSLSAAVVLINSLSATVVTHTTSISAINTAVTNLTNSLSAAVVLVNSLSGTVVTHTTQLNSLSATVVTHTASISAINTVIVTMSASLTTVTTQLNSLSATVVTHTLSLSAINTAITNLCIVNVKQYGALGNWNPSLSTGTDDTAAFQAAIDAVYAIGRGGVVRVPPVSSAYRLNSQIHVKAGVRLVGDTSFFPPNFYTTSIGEMYGGSCLAITWGSGTAGTPSTSLCSAVRLSPGTGLTGLSFIYPGQVTTLTAAAPTEFPPTVSGWEYDCPGGSIQDCWFVNSYKAVLIPYFHGELVIRRVWGQVLQDFIVLNGTLNADQLTDVNVSGIFYMRSSPDFNFTNNTGLLAYIQTYGVAFRIGAADAIRFTDCFVGNCEVGILFAASPEGGDTVGVPQYAYGSWEGGGIEGVTFPFYVDGSATKGLSPTGFRVSNAGIAPVALFDAARSVALVMAQATTLYSDTAETRGRMTFVGCNFWGNGSDNPNVGLLEGVCDTTGGDVDFVGCTFKFYESYIVRVYSGTPQIKFTGCTFNAYGALAPSFVHFNANAGAAGTILHSGCHFHSPQTVSYGGGATTYIQNYSVPSASSTATLTLPALGSFFDISGTVNITSVVASNPNRQVTLKFAAALTFTDGSNLKLAGNLVTTGDDTITLICDGTNWYEICRSIN